MLELFPSYVHQTLNRRVHQPWSVSRGLVMTNPHYPASVPEDVLEDMKDSGAFQKKDMLNRLTPRQAMDRQLKRWDRSRAKRRYTVIYDCLHGVDETIRDGERIKFRGTPETGARAVSLTLEAASFYDAHRNELPGPVVFSCQGVTTEQYISCGREIIRMMKPGDVFAFGGFCIIGNRCFTHLKLKDKFRAAVLILLPEIQAAGHLWVHVLGVAVTDCVAFFAIEAAKLGMRATNDTSTFELHSMMGFEWQPGLHTGLNKDWVKKWDKSQKFTEYHPQELTLHNIDRYVKWGLSLST